MRNVIEPKPIFAVCGKPLLLKLTMRGLLAIEDAFGTVRAGMDAVSTETCEKDTEQFIGAVALFFQR
jgi:hypothetical protein